MAIFNSYVKLPEGKFMNTLVLLMNYIPQRYPIESLSHTSPSLLGFPMIVATFYDTPIMFMPLISQLIPGISPLLFVFFYCFCIIVWFVH